ncbi:MAG: hypothetical protein R3C52_06050 [Hyphomonadaceae bacterium]
MAEASTRRGARRLLSPEGLAGLSLFGFCVLSALATGMGFADLRAANTGVERLGPAELAVTSAITVFVISAMVVALHQILAPLRPWWIRLVAAPFYLFFAVWSVGFGYGFFWKELAGQEYTERQLRGALSDLSQSLNRSSQAIGTAEAAVVDAAALARERAQIEATTGGACANHLSSSAGEGPLVRARFSFAERAGDLSSEARVRWMLPLEEDKTGLERRIAALASGTVPAGAVADAGERKLLADLAASNALPPAQRKALFLRVHGDARAFAERSNTARALNAGSFADRLDALSREVGGDPSAPGQPDPARAGDPGYCWDAALSDRMAESARQIRAAPEIVMPDFEFVEGPRATRAAFFGLLGWIGGVFGVEPLATDELPDDVSVRPKEFIALFASIAVDLGIVFLSLVGAARPVDRSARRAARAARGDGQPEAPRLASIADGAPGSGAHRSG